MRKVFDLGKDFEQKSKEQASTIEANLALVFKAHENAINTALHSSGQRINSAIQEQSVVLRWMVLKTWLSVGVALLVMLCLSGSVLWWQGTQIQDNRQLIAEQSNTLKKLSAKTWGVRFQEDTNGRFLVLPTGVKANPNWTFEDGTRQAVKLERK
ncbi:mobilization protein [Yersinia ruckeri]|nr:mobilization protein [Yersinia ruckeri]